MTTSEDDRRLEDLRRVLDHIDAGIVSDFSPARSAFAWRDLDVELAELVFDSSSDAAPVGVTVRGSDDDIRSMTFTAGTVSIEIEIEIGSHGLFGRIIPPQPASVEVHQAGADPTVLVADHVGVFQMPTPLPGPISLLARAPDGSWSVRTSWTVN